MARTIFRIGDKFISLPHLVSFDILPGYDWGEDEDEKNPRLHIGLLGNTWITITEREAKISGWGDIVDLVAALSNAMDAL